MPTPILITKDTLEHLTQDLKELAKKPKTRSLKDAIATLQPYIDQALNLGYAIDDVVSVLNRRGVSVSAKTLKRYLSEVRPETKSLIQSREQTHDDLKSLPGLTPETTSSDASVELPDSTAFDTSTPVHAANSSTNPGSVSSNSKTPPVEARTQKGVLDSD